MAYACRWMTLCSRLRCPADMALARALTAADLPGLLAVQLACYGEGFVENAAVFARRLAQEDLPADTQEALVQRYTQVIKSITEGAL